MSDREQAFRAGEPKRAGRILCEAFVEFVHAQDCCVCGAVGRSQCHHHGPKGLGQRKDDLFGVPLCGPDLSSGDPGCHRKYHDGNLDPADVAKIDRAQLETVQAFVMTMLSDLFHVEQANERKSRKLPKGRKLRSRSSLRPKRAKPLKMGQRDPDKDHDPKRGMA